MLARLLWDAHEPFPAGKHTSKRKHLDNSRSPGACETNLPVGDEAKPDGQQPRCGGRAQPTGSDETRPTMTKLPNEHHDDSFPTGARGSDAYHLPDGEWARPRDPSPRRGGRPRELRPQDWQHPPAGTIPYLPVSRLNIPLTRYRGMSSPNGQPSRAPHTWRSTASRCSYCGPYLF